MTDPFYDLNQFSPMPSVEGDHQSHLLPFSLLPADHTSSVPCPIFFNSAQVQEANNTDHHHLQQQAPNQQHQQEFIDHLSNQRSNNFRVSSFSTNTNNIAQRSLCDQHKREEDQQKSGKWMSSKMRIMRKMMYPDGIVRKKPRRSKQLLQEHQQPTHQGSSSSSSSNNNSPNDGVIRVCSDCNTTKTPLWRSGPSGPKSLCNACGIRQRKARRALAAAEAVSGGLMIPPVTPDRTIPFKKRCRFSTATGTTSQKQLCFEQIVISLSKSSAFHRVFPQDEKDAAILLMALSCGLMCS